MPKGTTRYVIDIEWDKVSTPYGGDGGSQDCGTVMSVINFLEENLEEFSETVGPNQKRAKKVKLVSYITNAKHPVNNIITTGKALHPTLRESKGKVGDSDIKETFNLFQAQTQVEINTVHCYNDSTEEEAKFILASLCPKGTITTWTDYKLPYSLKSDAADSAWKLDEALGQWYLGDFDWYEAEGWDLTPLKILQPLTKKSQVFVNPGLAGTDGMKIRELATDAGFEYIISHILTEPQFSKMLEKAYVYKISKEDGEWIDTGTGMRYGELEDDL